MKHAMIVAGLIGLSGGLSPTHAADTGSREIPESFVPFEHMVGSWKGTAVPTANRLKGWPETHLWAWKFAKGTPVGMALELKGDKTLLSGLLTYSPDERKYRLEGKDPSGAATRFVGALDSSGKVLVLERDVTPDGGKDRLTIRPNANLIRYTLELDHQEPGAPQFKRVIQVGLTKEGESFAAGGSASNLPKCILTGGSATMTVSYKGKSYPICCSGCRDEFNENPEKYARKAALMAESGEKPSAPATSRVGKGDGAFDGLVDDSEKPKNTTPAKRTQPASKPKPEAGSTGEADEPKAESKSAARAATQLRIAQNLEKSGKTAPALQYYRQVVKDFPDTPQAKTAIARIKALGGK